MATRNKIVRHDPTMALRATSSTVQYAVHTGVTLAKRWGCAIAHHGWLLGASRLLVVGADSATAAILAAGLGAASIAGVEPNSEEWLAYTSFIALICGAMLLVARVFKLGFLGDFMSTSVLIGFLTGVGVQVATGQLPDMLGIPKGSGSWLEQQWHLLKSLDDIGWASFAFAAGTLVIILGFKRFIPKVPGAVVAVVLLIIVSEVTNASEHGVAVVGSVKGGFPPIGLPDGISMDNLGTCIGIAFSCFILIIAQSAATSRSFAMKHGQNVDVSRDILGLSGAADITDLSLAERNFATEARSLDNFEVGPRKRKVRAGGGSRKHVERE